MIYKKKEILKYLFIVYMDNFAKVNDLGSNVFGDINTNNNSMYNTVLKYCSRERLIYLVTGIILLVCIYFYLKNKWAKEEKEEQDNIYLKNDDYTNSQLSENQENIESPQEMMNMSPHESPIDNQLNNLQENQYQTPPGFVTIPEDTYQQLQENFLNNNITPQDDYIESNGMENNLSNEEDFEASKELSDFNNMAKLESSDEEDRTRAQDLTNTEIQSIQNQLNSFKT